MLAMVKPHVVRSRIFSLMKKLIPIALLIFSYSLSAQKNPIFSTKDGAINGYDPVAYFDNGAPVKGSDSYIYEWSGATWMFSSEDNLATFKSNPEAYAPQFGGYCAYGVSQGGLFKTDPDAWKIVDGKLYLNYNLKFHTKWEDDQANLIEVAETKWPDLIEE